MPLAGGDLLGLSEAPCVFLDRSTALLYNNNVAMYHGSHLMFWRRPTRACPPPPARPLQVESHTGEGLLALVQRERTGEAVDRALLKSLLRMFNNLGTYSDAFERPFLERTATFYRAEGDRLMHELDVPAYLVNCEVGGHCFF